MRRGRVIVVDNRKRFVLGCLAVLVLLGLAFIQSSSQQGGRYNPWLDYNDDGIINVEDLHALGSAYGTSGISPAKAALAYDSDWIDIHDKRGQAFNITHNLDRADTFIDITGKWAMDGPIHQEINSATVLSPAGWDSIINDVGFVSMVHTTDGGYALAGETPGSVSDFILLKTDHMGVPQWNRTYGTPQIEVAYSVVQTSDGGYALAGFTYTNAPYYYDILLVKTDAAGNMQWNRTYLGTKQESPNMVIQTSDGGYAIAGHTAPLGTGKPDAYLVKTDVNGFMQWNRTFGGPGNEEAYSLVQTVDGGYAFTGSTDSYGAGSWDAWLVKTDSAGLMTWNRTYGGGGIEEAYSVIRTLDDGYALAGITTSGPAGFYLVKTNEGGNVMWNKTYGLGRAYSVVQTIDGGYAMAGTQSGYPSSIGGFVRTDSDGNELISQKYPGSIDAIVKTNDGGYTMMGDNENLAFHLFKTNDWGFISFPQVGLTALQSTPNFLTLYRGRNDPYWNYVRVRIWVMK